MGPCYRPPPTLSMGFDSTAMPSASPKDLLIPRSYRGETPPNGVGDNGAGAGTSGDSRSLYVRRRASEARALGYSALGGRYPLARHALHPAQHSNYCLFDGYRYGN